MIDLTEKGSETGLYLVKRNAILQEFLGIIQANCDFAAEAEAMEHYLSKSTIYSISRLLSFMKENPEIYRQFTEY
jgi:Mn-dependent DtxR family transcriptional regulator